MVLLGVVMVSTGADMNKYAGERTEARTTPWWRRRKELVVASVIVVLLVTIGVPAALLLSGDRNDTTDANSSEVYLQPKVYGESQSLLLAGSEQLVVVPRANWSRLPSVILPQLAHPTPYVVIKHTAGSECAGLSQCGRYLREVRELHWQRFQQPEISYNFLVDSVGNVYEGRGWDATNVNKGPVYRCNVDVALIGNYVEHTVPEAMAGALRKLLDHGVARGWLAADYRLLAHNQVTNTISPGHWALEAIKNWPHRCLSDCFEATHSPQP